jgi:hypothetical protein
MSDDAGKLVCTAQITPGAEHPQPGPVLAHLRLGVEGKAAGWCTLRTLADTDTRLDPARLDQLICRARQRADLLEDLRVSAADRVISARSA